MSFEQYAIKKEQARELAVILATLHELDMSWMIGKRLSISYVAE